MKTTNTVNTKMNERQAPLYEQYSVDPAAAIITDYAVTHSMRIPATDPLHGELELTHQRDVTVPVGVHTAVGGDGDAPTPGDILCGALAACLDSTIRIISNRLGITLESISVEVRGEIDVRGTLRASDECPVAFQTLQTHVDIQVPPEADEKLVQQILKAAEYSCVILQTLRGSPATPISASINCTEDQAIAG